MVSRSNSNLLELVSDETSCLGRLHRPIPRMVTASGIVPDLDSSSSDTDEGSSSSSSGPSICTIIVGNHLPIHAHRHSGGIGWTFSWDEDSLLLQLKDTIGDRGGGMEFMQLLGVDDMNIFMGISLKLLAFKLLLQHPEFRGMVVLVQIANPARGSGKDVEDVRVERSAMVKGINDMFHTEIIRQGNERE
ncbi:Alpha,alpha-trehalose-phosphate synthase [UDP-forming] 5 [Platanthera guangdongensis]|uniref:Alpha,alpha-trehalose-phosphate synthase [UDP-forming] 5 n=1 Tax=Platanthera guangdongensis TaxID=2320717 RepID=A0ABR2N3A4_9ASPA